MHVQFCFKYNYALRIEELILKLKQQHTANMMMMMMIMIDFVT